MKTPNNKIKYSLGSPKKILLAFSETKFNYSISSQFVKETLKDKA